MGLFSRDSGSGTDRRKSGRSTDPQASELRVRARRRLVGALVLVVAAVIVVPMLIDTNPPANEAVQPIVLPPVASSSQGQLAATDNTGSITIEQVDIPSPSNESDGGTTQQPPASQTASSAASPENDSRSSSATESAQSTSNPEPQERKPEADSAESPAAKKPSDNQAPAPSSPEARSDDGAVALALLEGRQPPGAQGAQATQEESGNFVLQIAAYTTEQDANARRDKLFEAGVSNAFVERATSAGKPTYRLRVGPFPSKEAAQAAQTRLRALGYDNGFISSK